MKAIILSFFLLLSSVLINPVFCQPAQTTIENINRNPWIYSSKYVEIEGTIIQYVHATSLTNTNYYVIKDNFGFTLKVHTGDIEPKINHEFRVTGILYFEKILQRNGNAVDSPFLSEKERIDLSEIPPPPVDETFFHKYLYYIIGIVAGLLVIGGGLFFFVRTRNKNKQLPPDWQAEPLATDYSQIPKMDVPPPYQPTIPDNDFKTIKINTTPSKTMRLIPGHLEITNGEDKGKAFLIQGYPTKEGSIITIGREVVSGEKSHSHIQIDSRYQTVSRKQAELIYMDKKLNIRNLSETNITIVDGNELSLGAVVELHAGSVIKMGEIEFQYKL